MIPTARARLAILATVFSATTAVAQAPSARRIATLATPFAEPFSAVSHLVELADGRVLLFDPVERRLGVADFARGTFGEIARPGQGPLEYRSVHAMHRIAGDSVLIWDPGNDRVQLVAPGGKLIGTWPQGARDGWATTLIRATPRAIRGDRWYLTSRPAASADTTTLLRLDAAKRSRDTLARFVTPELRPRRTTAGVTVAAPGFPPRDAWGVWPDGRVVVVDGSTYRPVVIHPDGTRRPAAAIPFTPLPVTPDDRARHLREVADELKRRLTGELAAGGGGKMPRIEAEAPATWPRHLPPLRGSEILVDSRGRGWLLVTDPERRAGDRFDLLDGDGRRVDAVRLPESVHLVAMGRDVFYAVHEADDGLVHLLRYPLP